MKQGLLFRQVIFIDWHGVLSRDPFWTSILQSNRHPLRSALEEKLGQLFSPGNETAHEWMRGRLTSQDVVSEMGIALGTQFRDDFLVRRLHADCNRMHMNLALLKLLRSMGPATQLVLATDNMDCFAETFKHARRGRRRGARQPGDGQTLASSAVFCDDMICSSDVGVLKAENPAAFFGPWLSEFDMGFSDGMLIDDRADNCAAFESQGGTTIQWKLGRNELQEIVDPLRLWLANDRGRA